MSDYIHQNLPSELDKLSIHTRPDEVFDIDIDDISISGENIFVKGDGVISVEMQFRSDRDQGDEDGLKTFDKFPFDFEVTLTYKSKQDKKELEIIKVEKLDIDTSSYDDD